MSEDEKTKPRHPEINFLPPLDMVLTFFNKFRKSNEKKKEETEEKNVEKLIEKLSEQEK